MLNIFKLSSWYIYLFGATINQIVCKVINQTPVEILVHIAKAVALSREKQHIETLVRADKCIHYTQGAARVYILVDVTVYEQEVTLKALCKLVVRRDMVLENSLAITLYLADTVVLLAPPAVVDVVVVVTCARYRNIEEVGVHKQRCGRHKATTRVTVDTYA